MTFLYRSANDNKKFLKNYETGYGQVDPVVDTNLQQTPGPATSAHNAPTLDNKNLPFFIISITP